MSQEKGVIVSKESKISKIVNVIKNLLFGRKIRNSNIQNSIDKIKMENEYLNNQKEDANLAQVIIATNEKRIAAFNYMKNLKKSKNKKEIIIVE